jgi:putative SOS response-associated peptidase YedK
MCGRFSLATPPDRLAQLYDAQLSLEGGPEDLPSWNVAPTREILGVSADSRRDGPPGRVLGAFRWGLIPSWASDVAIGNKLFNARAETVVTKPAFRAAFAARRLAIPADGFFEWRRGPVKLRQPYFFYRADGDPMTFAGLWEAWPDPRAASGSWVRSCTIITAEASSDMNGIHNRMPVVLERDTWDLWLNPRTARPDQLAPLLRPAPPGTLACHAVDPRVGNSNNDGPDLVEAKPLPATLGI